MKKSKKQLRKEALTELISLYPVEDQSTLADLLQEKYNIEVNQSIVSRDLRELGVTKKIVGDSSIYELNKTNTTYELLVRAVVEVVHNETTIIIKTVPGLASFVGDFLDEQNVPGILATLAGENVVFVIPNTTKSIAEIYQTTCKILYFKISQKRKGQ